MPTTANRNVCPHAFTQSADETKQVDEGKGTGTTTHTFAVYTCSLCGQVLKRELPINA
jgi:hypothetical protein